MSWDEVLKAARYAQSAAEEHGIAFGVVLAYSPDVLRSRITGGLMTNGQEEWFMAFGAGLDPTDVPEDDHFIDYNHFCAFVDGVVRDIDKTRAELDEEVEH